MPKCIPAIKEMITSAYTATISLIDPSEPTLLMPEYSNSAHAMNGSAPA